VKHKVTPWNCAYLGLAGHTELVLAAAIFVQSCFGIRPPQGSLPAQFTFVVFGVVLGILVLLEANRIARELGRLGSAIVAGSPFVVAAVATLLSLHPIQPLQHRPDWLLPLIHCLR
jgi:hypothetical protein